MAACMLILDAACVSLLLLIEQMAWCRDVSAYFMMVVKMNVYLTKNFIMLQQYCSISTQIYIQTHIEKLKTEQ